MNLNGNPHKQNCNEGQTGDWNSLNCNSNLAFFIQEGRNAGIYKPGKSLYLTPNATRVANSIRHIWKEFISAVIDKKDAERRLYERHELKERFFITFRPHLDRIGWITDISKGGIS